MKKAEMVRDIIEVLNWAKDKKEYGTKLYGVMIRVANLNWYESNKLMTRVLMRVKKEKLAELHHDIIEAIY